MDKILFLGDNVHTAQLILAARNKGIYTIITDNRAAEESKSKQLADECWDISVMDFDALEKRSKDVGINGISCGASEVCSGAVRELCRRLNLPFWVGDKAWEYTNDKRKFKEICKECGLPVAKDYKLNIDFNEKDFSEIEYPVVVKPVDSCSSIGMHICSNKEELVDGYRDAYSKSMSKKVIVEKYISGLQVSLIYLFSKGRPIFFTAFDSYGDQLDRHPMIFGANPTSYSRKLQDEWEIPLQMLFQKLECNSGIGFVQILANDDEAAVMEMNYRLPGSHFINELILHEHMIRSSLSRDVEYDIKALTNNEKNNQSFIYFIWLKPGKIGCIDGIDIICENIPVIEMNDIKKVGDIIQDNSGMRQILTGIVFSSEKRNVAGKIDFINKHIKVEDELGNDMVYRYEYKEF
ncbi:ATP-grasp domain-containing protein [Butyrivibrio sp. MB2005]|uniref:ATP-grasp domain-containing protein n=1 Tax=Butyrivibrio sp. MB2005 TaxID=1280678 RepID=UPI0004093AF8|nr:ATP-grasp domain-containing protein [Butyrivibrio sp. MB2005]